MQRDKVNILHYDNADKYGISIKTEGHEQKTEKMDITPLVE